MIRLWIQRFRECFEIRGAGFLARIGGLEKPRHIEFQNTRLAGCASNNSAQPAKASSPGN
jgi:hypothetical protein